MPYPETQLQPMFDHLVGDESRIEATYNSLVLAVNSEYSKKQDSYARLSDGIESMVGHLAAEGEKAVRGSEEEDWEIVGFNARLGVRLIPATLRAVGEAYATYAAVEQTVPNLEENTLSAMRYICGIAVARRGAAFRNMSAIRLGLSPRNPLVLPLLTVSGKLPGVIDKPKVSKRAFVAATEDDGQVTLQPRHQRLSGMPKQGRGCPAPHIRTGAEGKKRPALLTLMQVVSSVAINEIFPEQFPVAAASSH